MDGIFENFVSLGFNCSVALAMEKMGLRCCRGPFDWYISDFEGVLSMLENDFSDFLYAPNLQMKSKGQFEDIKYHFLYPHEILAGQKVEDNLEKIRKKYEKDITNFNRMVKAKTCFIRAVSDLRELNFVNTRIEKVYRIIREHNKENDIIFLIRKKDWQCIEDCNMPHVFLIDGYNNEDCEKNILFEKNHDIISFLEQHSDAAKRGRNILFSVKKTECMFKRYYARYGIAAKLFYMKGNEVSAIRYLERNAIEKVAVFGCGQLGKMVREVIGGGRVSYFLDAHSTVEYEGETPVYGIVPRNWDVDIIIFTPVWEEEKIRGWCREIYGREVPVIGLQDFCAECLQEMDLGIIT